MSEELKEKLVIYPADRDRKVEDLVFSRTREVEVNWETILSATGPLEKTEDGTDAIRLFLEKLWDIDDDNDSYPSSEDVQKAKQTVSLLTAAAIIVQPISGGQEYTIHARENAQFSSMDLDTPAHYQAFWRDKVDRLEVPSGAKSDIEEMDLAGPVILKQYKELDALRKLAEKFDGKADELISSQIEQLLGKEQLDELISKYQTMKEPLRDVEEALIRLKDAAADLGYILNIGESAIVYNFPNSTDSDTIEPGQLYRPYYSWISWIVTHFRRVVRKRRFLFWTRRTVHYIPYPVRHIRRVKRRRKIIVDLDPWVEREAELESEGKKSFRFEREGDEYLTSSGESIDEVLIRCEQDSGFWEQCVVWIPVYEQSLVEGDALVKYILIHKPLRGVESLALPTIYLQEELSYKSNAETRVELGSLVHTINLAPGERRTVAVERSLSRTQETTKTATSLIDLVNESKTDFSTEFEKEARREKEKTKSSNWSASASGGWGPFSASAGGGGTSSMTVNQFAKNVSRIARKASRNVTKKTREEVSVSSSVKTSVSRKESTSIEIENNNDGRTLNLAFYQLNSIHIKGLYLESLRFVVFTGIECVGGSGLLLPKTFSLSELREALGAMAFGSLPIRERENSEPDYREKRRKDYVALISIDLISTIEEYTAYLKEEPNFNVIKDRFKNYDAFSSASEDLEKILEDLQTKLDEIVTDNIAIGGGTQNVVVGSVGLYTDSYVGVRPSTEPYAEKMRDSELAYRNAEISEVLARADAQRSVATGFIPPANEMRNATSNGTLRKLQVEFRSPPTKGIWELWVETVNTSREIVVSDESKDYEIQFDEDQIWLDASRKNLCRLVHEVTREAVHFFV